MVSSSSSLPPLPTPMAPMAQITVPLRHMVLTNMPTTKPTSEPITQMPGFLSHPVTGVMFVPNELWAKDHKTSDSGQWFYQEGEGRPYAVCSMHLMHGKMQPCWRTLLSGYKKWLRMAKMNPGTRVNVVRTKKESTARPLSEAAA